MKAIQVTMDNDLLAALDKDEEVRHRGRSAVMRQITREYLQRRQQAAISEQYRRAYNKPGMPDDFAGWENQGSWPSE